MAMRITYVAWGNDKDFGDDTGAAIRYVTDRTSAEGQLECLQERYDNLLKVLVATINSLGSDRRAAVLSELGFEVKR